MPLHEVKRDTKRALYCGPTAICLTTGERASRVLELVEAHRGEHAYRSDGRLKGVMGMWNYELVGVLTALGYGVSFAAYEAGWRPTTAQWLKNVRRDMRENGAPKVNRIIVVSRPNGGTHYVAVSDTARIVSCSLMKRLTPAAMMPGRRARVHWACEVWPSS